MSAIPFQSPVAALKRITRFDARLGLVREAWDRLHTLPGGKGVFSRLVGTAAPYTGTIGAKVVALGRGHATVELADRRAVRNHLGCVHAIALANLAEVCANIALVYSMPDDARFIVTNLSIDYLKKARGTITATTTCPVPESNARVEFEVPVELHDANGVLVARSTLRSLVGPLKTAE